MACVRTLLELGADASHTNVKGGPQAVHRAAASGFRVLSLPSLRVDPAPLGPAESAVYFQVAYSNAFDCRQHCCSRASPTAWCRRQCGQQCRVSPSVGCRCLSSPAALYHTTHHLCNSAHHRIRQCDIPQETGIEVNLHPDLQARGRKRWPHILSAMVQM